jgi:hypothetical protein
VPLAVPNSVRYFQFSWFDERIAVTGLRLLCEGMKLLSQKGLFLRMRRPGKRNDFIAILGLLVFLFFGAELG